MKNTDDLSHINESFDLLVKKIEEASDTPSQDEMGEIVALFNEISKLEIMTGESDIQNSDTKKKK